jgi:hypothetical protein
MGCFQPGAGHPVPAQYDESTDVLLSFRPGTGNPSHPLGGWSLTDKPLLLFPTAKIWAGGQFLVLSQAIFFIDR